MKYCYLLYKYKPKYHYDGFIHEGRYIGPYVYEKFEKAKEAAKKHNHATYIRRVKYR